MQWVIFYSFLALFTSKIGMPSITGKANFDFFDISSLCFESQIRLSFDNGQIKISNKDSLK